MVNLKTYLLNKKVIGLSLIIGLLVLLGGIFFIRAKKFGPLVSPVGQEEEGEVLLSTWEDQAGFSFLYPEEVKIDPHEEDEENYAHLELVSSDHPGRILIFVKETTYQEIDDWATEEASPGAQVLDTQLGGEPAKKVAYSDPEKLVVATIDVDALVLLELEPDKEGFWQGIFDQILTSFAFIPVEGEEVAPAGGESAPAGDGIIWEAEEVIE
ncbi:MAG TPA: hypothetical protein VMX77_01680 [Candidatus Bathyarchaeia archaeon]|nr:hypothetical protein [Candidatus Bathyarchaeia archaeon]